MLQPDLVAGAADDVPSDVGESRLSSCAGGLSHGRRTAGRTRALNQPLALRFDQRPWRGPMS